MNERVKKIDRSALSDSFLQAESKKSNLILEANLLQQQELYPVAADKFAEAAEIEEQLTQVLIAQNRWDKAFIHRFSAISCWVQAGNLHRALSLGQQLLATDELPAPQRSRVEEYINTLQERMTEWMSQWVPHPLSAGD